MIEPSNEERANLPDVTRAYLHDLEQRTAACERAGNLSVELAAMTRNRDELRQALNRVARERDSAEEERNHALERAWSAENSLTIRRSLCRDIAVELGCEGLEGDAQLEAGLAAIRTLKQGKEGAPADRAAVADTVDPFVRPHIDLALGACPKCAGYCHIPTWDGDGNETGTEPCDECDGGGRERRANMQ
jgi:hypothetical protein